MEYDDVKDRKYATREEALHVAVTLASSMDRGAVVTNDGTGWVITEADEDMYFIDESASVTVDGNGDPMMDTLEFNYDVPDSYAVYELSGDGTHTEWTELNTVKDFLAGLIEGIVVYTEVLSGTDEDGAFNGTSWTLLCADGIR